MGRTGRPLGGAVTKLTRKPREKQINATNNTAQRGKNTLERSASAQNRVCSEQRDRAGNCETIKMKKKMINVERWRKQR